MPIIKDDRVFSFCLIIKSATDSSIQECNKTFESGDYVSALNSFLSELLSQLKYIKEFRKNE